MIYPKEVISNIKNSISIDDVISYCGIPFQNRSGRKSILCPFHNDTHFGSCVVNTFRNNCHCFVCDKSFDSIELIRQVNGVDFSDAVKTLADMIGYPLEEKKYKKTKGIFLTRHELELLNLTPTPQENAAIIGVSNIPEDNMLHKNPRFKSVHGEYFRTDGNAKITVNQFLKEDPDAAKQMLYEKVEEAKEARKNMINKIDTHKASTLLQLPSSFDPEWLKGIRSVYLKELDELEGIKKKLKKVG